MSLREPSGTNRFSEIERQKQIAANQELLNSLGLDADGTAKISFAKPKPASKPASATKKRKSEASTRSDEGPRRRSGRIAGLEADGEAIKVKLEKEEEEREVLRIQNRRAREQVMAIDDMHEQPEKTDVDSLVSFPLLRGIARVIISLMRQGCPAG